MTKTTYEVLTEIFEANFPDASPYIIEAAVRTEMLFLDYTVPQGREGVVDLARERERRR